MDKEERRLRDALQNVKVLQEEKEGVSKLSYLLTGGIIGGVLIASIAIAANLSPTPQPTPAPSAVTTQYIEPTLEDTIAAASTQAPTLESIAVPTYTQVPTRMPTQAPTATEVVPEKYLVLNQNDLSWRSLTEDPYDYQLIYAFPGFMTQGSEGLEGAAYSPDGKRVAFVTFTGQNYRLYSINVDGSNLNLLVDSPDINNRVFGSIAWNSDGSKIFFKANEHMSGRNEIVIYSITETGDIATVKRGLEYFSALSMLKNGSIFFSNGCHGSRVINQDGTGFKKPTSMQYGYDQLYFPWKEIDIKVCD